MDAYVGVDHWGMPPVATALPHMQKSGAKKAAGPTVPKKAREQKARIKMLY